MSFLIPRGTPVELAQYGTFFYSHTTNFYSHTTKRDLTFVEAFAETNDRLKFHDGYWVLIVSRDLVLEKDGGEIPI